METTDRFGIPYPSDGQKDWVETWESGWQNVDSTLFAGWEDANLIPLGGGRVEWDGELLSWSEDIILACPTHGRNVSIPAGNLKVEEGEFVVLTVARGPTTHVAGSVEAVSVVPPDGTSRVMAMRPSGETYLAFRSGAIVRAGDAGGSTGIPDRYRMAMTLTSVPAGDTAVIPAGFQWLVHGDLVVDGEVIAEGDLVIL